ncbi:MAG: HD domain-containing protein [Spirochaetales bacterium]|nr:HD domain-containing protein [Spirochaetales bacterium]
MLDNIRAHSLQVARVAVMLTHELLQVEVDVVTPGSTAPGACVPTLDVDLVTAGALLHDIAKTQCLNGACSHAEVGGAICSGLGFAEVAVIVMQHVILADYNRPVSEIDVVYYADKRVRHDEIVTLDERQVYIEDRYGQGVQEIIDAIRLNFGKCYDVEKRIFSSLPFAPDDVADQVELRCFPF